MSNILVRKAPVPEMPVGPAITGGAPAAIMPGGQIFVSGPAGYQIPIGGGRSKGNIQPSQRDLTHLSRDRPALGNIKVMKPEQRMALNRPTAANVAEAQGNMGVVRDMGRRNELARGARRDKLARLASQLGSGYAALAATQNSDDLMGAGSRAYGTYAAGRAATGEGALEGSYDQDEEGNITRTPSAFERGFGDLREGTQETGSAIGRKLRGAGNWLKDRFSRKPVAITPPVDSNNPMGFGEGWETGLQTPTTPEVDQTQQMYDTIDALPPSTYQNPNLAAFVSQNPDLVLDQRQRERQNIGQVLVNSAMTGQAPSPAVGMGDVGMNMPPPTQATGFDPRAVGEGEVGTEPVMNTKPTDPKQTTLDQFDNNQNQQPATVGGDEDDPFKGALKGEPMDMAWELLKGARV